MVNKSPERRDLPKATQPVKTDLHFICFSLEEKANTFRDLLLAGDQSFSFLSRTTDTTRSPGAIYVSKLQPGKLAAEGRRPGSVTTVSVLFRLLLIMLVASLASGLCSPRLLFSLQLHRPWLGHGGAKRYLKDQLIRTAPNFF